jgi:hypothetical protein
MGLGVRYGILKHSPRSKAALRNLFQQGISHAPIWP